jgi:glutamine---fructose-6-phosphate transaminase (isomerizing)
MRAEIHEQPAVYERILGTGRKAIAEVAAAIRRREPRFVLFAARGTSDHAALYGKYLVEARLGLPAGLASPSTTTLYDSRPRMEGVLLIAVSQSGSSPDVAQATERARDGGATTVAITNDRGSKLGDVAEFHIGLRAGEELAVAATKTYTAELLTLFLLLETLGAGEVGDAASLPHLAANLLEIEPLVESTVTRYRFADQLLVTSRGYNFPTALESALKLVEAAQIPAHAFSGADLMHGPMAMVDRGFPVVVIAPDGPGSESMRPVLQILDERRADVLLVGEALAIGRPVIPLPTVPEHLSPMLAIIPMQLFALHLARNRGFDPDRPSGLTKVTRTV